MDDIRFDKIWEDHWRDLAKESNDKKKIHALRWCVYVKEKEEIITRLFLVSVPHPKGGKIAWTSVKDHVIEEKEDYKEIGLRGFYCRVGPILRQRLDDIIIFQIQSLTDRSKNNFQNPIAHGWADRPKSETISQSNPASELVN